MAVLCFASDSARPEARSGLRLRVPAIEIEPAVAEAVRAALSASDDHRSSGSQSGHQETSRAPADLTARLAGAANNTADLRAAVERVAISKTTIEIELAEGMAPDDQNRILIIPWKPHSPHRRREVILGEGEQPCTMRPMRTKARIAIISALGDAHRRLNELTTNPNRTIETIAAQERQTERWTRRTLSLAFLCPTLARAAVVGRLPRGFGVKRLADLPLIWAEQWSALGLKTSIKV
jgi:hypothetical protein